MREAAALTVMLCLACRMENLFINRFMHMFQSSWSDFADFEKIFVKISNTISGECAHGPLAVLGRLPGSGKGRPLCPSKAGLPGPAAQASPRPGCRPALGCVPLRCTFRIPTNRARGSSLHILTVSFVWLHFV